MITTTNLSGEPGQAPTRASSPVVVRARRATHDVSARFNGPHVIASAIPLCTNVDRQRVLQLSDHII
jgi:hypothetical protein